MPLASAHSVTQQNNVTTTLNRKNAQRAEKYVGSRHVGAHISRTDKDIFIPKKDSERKENPLQRVGTHLSSHSNRYFSIPRRAPKIRRFSLRPPPLKFVFSRTV
jgi:hypothetical protein